MMFIHHRHGKEAIPHRFDRFAMEADRAVDPTTETRRTTALGRDAGSFQRHLLCDPHRVCVAFAAARLSAVGNSLVLFPSVACQRNLGNDQRAAAGTGSPQGAPSVGTTHRSDRLSKCQDNRSGWRKRLRRGEKKSKAASGTCSLTRSVLSCPAWCIPPVCRIATERNGCWPVPRSTSPDCESFARMPGMRDDSSPGLGTLVTGRWRSSAARLPDSSCYRNVGSSNGPSPGWGNTADSQKITNTSLNRAKHLFTSP